MMQGRYDRAMEFAKMHLDARQKSGKSQEYVAMELGVTKKTISNWENGVSSPTFFQSLEYFKALNINPFPLYLRLVYHSKLNVSKDVTEVDKAFDNLVQTIPSSAKEQILYMYCGEHGSSPNMILQLITAYLHCPLTQRVMIATLIAHGYELEKELGAIICPDDVQPDMERLNKAIMQGRISAIKHEYGYSMEEMDEK